MSRHEDRQKRPWNRVRQLLYERAKRELPKSVKSLGGGADAALECAGTEAAVDQPWSTSQWWTFTAGVPHYNNRALGSPLSKIFQWQVEQPLLLLMTNKFC